MQYENCKAEFADLHKKLDKLDEAWRGNGKPGIQMRLDRLEQTKSFCTKVFWLVVGIGATVLGKIIYMAWIS